MFASAEQITGADVPRLAANVPNRYCVHATSMAEKMIKHPCFGRPYQWSVKDFEMGASLGRGKFGRVYYAREIATKFIVAMKVTFKSELVAGRVEKQVLREIEIQSRLKHPNILRLYTWFHDDRRIYMAVELASQGELYRHLKDSPNGRFNEHRAAKYTFQVADALHYCHVNNVIHRDLKPENIMLTIHDNVKLADFGWSVHTNTSKRKTMCGTLDYLPPEMVEGGWYDESIDQWCLGILSYEFLVGNPPFEASNTEQTYKKIRELVVHYPKFMSAKAKHLIAQLLQKDSKLRITLLDVMMHPWIAENIGHPGRVTTVNGGRE